MRELRIGENDGGIRLDKFLSRYFPTMPRSLMYKYIRNRCVRLNGRRASESDILSAGDMLTFYISDEFFGVQRDDAFLRIKPRVDVVYEDENILIADKPAGLLVHSDDSESYNTLINHIKAYLYEHGEYDPATENSFAPALCNRIDRNTCGLVFGGKYEPAGIAPALCNRIDRNTCGLVFAAKNAASLRAMNEKIKNREIGKFYLCVVHGLVRGDSGELRGFIEKDAEKNKVRVSESASSGAKESVTRYRVIARDRTRALTLLEVELVTGRTHQIRASFAACGHPLLGDGKYAVNKKDRERGFFSQALCAYRAEFRFRTFGTVLDYLDGRVFTAREPAFLSLFGY